MTALMIGIGILILLFCSLSLLVGIYLAATIPSLLSTLNEMKGMAHRTNIDNANLVAYISQLNIIISDLLEVVSFDGGSGLSKSEFSFYGDDDEDDYESSRLETRSNPTPLDKEVTDRLSLSKNEITELTKLFKVYFQNEEKNKE